MTNTVCLPPICPYIGPFKWCQRTDCWNAVNGECKWCEENTQITYSNGTGPCAPDSYTTKREER